jgi:DNA repair exonuclease SbcCD ATPase subunit
MPEEIIEVSKLEDIKKALKATIAETKLEISRQNESLQGAMIDLIGDKESRLSALIQDCEKLLNKLSAKQDRLEESDIKQTTAIEELSAIDRSTISQLDKLTRQAEELQTRLDGTRIPQIKELNLEAVRMQVSQTADLLAGTGGQLPYREIQSSLQNTKFLGQVLKVLLGIFGFGGVSGAAYLLLGVNKAPDLTPLVRDQATQIQVLEAKIKAIEKDSDRLEKRIDRGIAAPGK